MKYFKIILLWSVILFSKYSFGWGAKGHKLIAEIAKKSLSQPIIDSVQKYLGKMTFEEASVWMDEIRSDHSYDNLKPLHYVNVEKDKTYVKNNDENIVNTIEYTIKLLKTRIPKDKERNDKMVYHLKLLFHLMGDLHQPLHCGYADDKGGNTVQVQINGQGSNLHKVWDSELIESANITLSDCLTFANTLSSSEKEQILKADIEGIVKESRELLPTVYDFDKSITKEYIDKNKVVVEKQLVRAGFRLASVLNDAFK